MKLFSQKQLVAKICDRLENMWPHAHLELNYTNDFNLLIAVVLSAQTTDKAVNKALAPFLEQYPHLTPDDLLAFGENEFFRLIRTIGLAPTKTKNCFKTAELLKTKFNGIVPRNRDDLESLPGVGRKTANVILNTLCQLPTFAVDTHVERVTKRLGLAKPNMSRFDVEQQVQPLIPKKYALNAHHLFVFHGRYHCLARKPKCNTCPLNDLCPKINVKM